jgi:SEC-C motif-containing protein
MHGGKPADTAEALMRSRYSAYALEIEDYLLRTWHPNTRPPAPLFEDHATVSRRWIGLEIRHTANQGEDTATVEFVARYRVGGRAQRLHETSRFVRQDGFWYYVDGDIK